MNDLTVSSGATGATIATGAAFQVPPPEAVPLRLHCGDAEGFVRMAATVPDLKAVVWNERQISLLAADRMTWVSYAPEINPLAAIFFARGENRRLRDAYGMPTGPIVWEGEFEPVVFQKGKLVAYLKAVAATVAKETLDAIQNLKVTTKKTEDSALLSLADGSVDDDNTRTVVEETMATNLPKQFTLSIPLTANYTGHLEFEAQVAALVDDWGRDSKKNGIQIRCINARAVLRDMMQQTLAALPAAVPQYYGAMSLEPPKNDR